MLEEDIDQSVQVEDTPENKEAAANQEYQRTKEQLKQFLQMQHPEDEKDVEEPSEMTPWVEMDALEDASEEYYHRFKPADDVSTFQVAYDGVIDLFSGLSRKKELDEEYYRRSLKYRGKQIEKGVSLVKRIIKDWSDQEAAVKTKCPRETLLKGILFLMNTKNSELLVELCVCAIQIVRSLYASYKEATDRSPDYYYVFNCLLSTVKVMYKCSKESVNDTLFRSVTGFIFMRLEYSLG